MNAIIILNHFCEVHGPQTIFSTQTIRDRSLLLSGNVNNNNIATSSSGTSLQSCEACSSVKNIVFLSQDNDSSIMFVSSEKSILGREHQNSLKQTALRSLCEVGLKSKNSILN